MKSGKSSENVIKSLVFRGWGEGREGKPNQFSFYLKKSVNSNRKVYNYILDCTIVLLLHAYHLMAYIILLFEK